MCKAHTHKSSAQRGCIVLFSRSHFACRCSASDFVPYPSLATPLSAVFFDPCPFSCDSSVRWHGGASAAAAGGGVMAAQRQRLPDPGAAQGSPGALPHQRLPPRPRYVLLCSPPPISLTLVLYHLPCRSRPMPALLLSFTIPFTIVPSLHGMNLVACCMGALFCLCVHAAVLIYPRPKSR